MKGGTIMADNKIGVINEQGYVGAQLGYTPLNEADQKSLKDEENKKKDNKEDK
jgi:hypothetical protein